MTEEQEYGETWGTSTGLVEEFTGVISGSIFTFDSQYQNGEALVLKLTADPVDDDELEQQTIFLSCGKDWDAKDRGARAEHPRLKQFNNQSNAGMFVDALMKLKNFNKVAARGGANEAKTFEGLTIHFKNTPVERTIKGETTTKGVLLPVEIVDVPGATKAATRGRKKAETPAAVAEVAEVADAGVGTDVLDAEFLGELNDMVAEVKGQGGDHAQFAALVRAEFDPADLSEDDLAAVDNAANWDFG